MNKEHSTQGTTTLRRAAVLAVCLLFGLAACTSTPDQPGQSGSSGQSATAHPTSTDLVGHCPDDVINAVVLPTVQDYTTARDNGATTDSRVGTPSDVEPAELAGLAMGCVVVLTSTEARTPTQDNPNDHQDQQWIWAALKEGTDASAVGDALKSLNYNQPYQDTNFWYHTDEDTFTMITVQVSPADLPPDAFPGATSVIMIKKTVN